VLVYFRSHTEDCFQDVTEYQISLNALPPIEYTFAKYPPRNQTEKVFCHGLFNASLLGNTVVWEFVETPNPLPVLWSGNDTLVDKKFPVGNATANASGLSTGQKIGIGIGATAGLIMVVLLSWLLFWRFSHRNKHSSPARAIQRNPDLFTPETNMTGISELGLGKPNNGLGRAELEHSEMGNAKIGKGKTHCWNILLTEVLDSPYVVSSYSVPSELEASERRKSIQKTPLGLEPTSRSLT
jgi:hypothetical protein